MNTPLPGTFLQRISAYPDEVQTLLKRNLDTAAVEEVLTVLHGASSFDGDKLQELAAKPILVDAFIGRMLVSKKFQQRCAQMLRLLSTDKTAVLRSMIADFLTPLGDPAQPYLHKMREIIATSDIQAHGEHLDAVAALADLHHRLLEGSGDARDIALRELALGGTPQAAPLLATLIEAMGGPAGLVPQPLVARDAGLAFVNAIFSPKAPPRLDDADILTLESIQRGCGDRTGELHLQPARQLQVRLSAKPGKAVAPEWETVCARVPGVTLHADPKAGDAAPGEPASGHHTLTMSPDLPPSPLLLAVLRILDTDGREVVFLAPPGDSVTSWEQQIVGHPDPETEHEIGRMSGRTLDARGDQGDQVCRIQTAAPRTGAPFRLSEVDPAEAYAILLCLDDAPDPATFINAENCLVVSGFDALVSGFSDAPAEILQKPVVVLGGWTPRDPDYLIGAVQTFMGYAGRYPVTPVAVTHDALASQFSLTPADTPALSHLALLDYMTLPLPQALNLASRPGTGDGAGAGLVCLPEQLIVCDARPAFRPDEAALAGQTRGLNHAATDPELHEMVFANSAVDVSGGGMAIAHWPIAALIRHATNRGRQLSAALNKFSRSPTPALAGRIMQFLTLDDTGQTRTGQIDGFALKLSMQPDILLEMDGDFLQDFLRLARQTPSMDRVAENIMPLARTLCRADHTTVIPLFELLACSLTPEALNATLAFVATELVGASRRAQYRIGECLRRYGSVGTLLQHLVLIQKADPGLLDEPDFARFYQRVLDDTALPAVRAMVGGKVIDRIAATVDFRTGFMTALLGGRRDTAAEMIRDIDRTRDADFISWLDSLRGHSNELYEMALPTDDAAFHQVTSVYGAKLMATTFSDVASLERMRAAGLLDDGSDLSLIARNVLRDNAPLNAMLADRFAGSGVEPLRIEGDDTAGVFANAAAATAASRAPASAPAGPDGPRVSVIISAFNADIDLFRLSLASVLEQTHRNVEVFVVDDASAAENSALLQAAIAEAGTTETGRDKAGGDKVHYIRVEQNSGPYVGRNLAIEAASGDFIAIQDADDWSHPDRFAQQLAVFAQSDLIQLVTAQHIRIDRHGRVQMEAGFSVLGDGPMTSMFRRSALDRVGVFAPVRSRGDVEMRERVRSYFGNHSIREIELAMMLCLADSATLSQRTKAEKHEFLQLFRSNISERRPLGALHSAGQPLGPSDMISVPLALRPPNPDT